jgi:hypothetical protein
MVGHYFQGCLHPARIGLAKWPGTLYLGACQGSLSFVPVLADPSFECPAADSEFGGLRRVPLGVGQGRVVFGTRLAGPGYFRAAGPIAGKDLLDVRGSLGHSCALRGCQPAEHSASSLVGVIGGGPTGIGDHPDSLRQQQFAL